jgi:hypothetical protein
LTEIWFQIYRFYYFIICLEISLKTAVNSICLGTCSYLFSFVRLTVSCVSRSGCKVQLLLISQAFLKSFLESFFLLFFKINTVSRVSLTQYLYELVSAVTDGKYNYFFLKHFFN